MEVHWVYQLLPVLHRLQAELEHFKLIYFVEGVLEVLEQVVILLVFFPVLPSFLLNGDSSGGILLDIPFLGKIHHVEHPPHCGVCSYPAPCA